MVALMVPTREIRQNFPPPFSCKENKVDPVGPREPPRML